MKERDTYSTGSAIRAALAERRQDDVALNIVATEGELTLVPSDQEVTALATFATNFGFLIPPNPHDDEDDLLLADVLSALLVMDGAPPYLDWQMPEHPIAWPDDEDAFGKLYPSTAALPYWQRLNQAPRSPRGEQKGGKLLFYPQKRS